MPGSVGRDLVRPPVPEQERRRQEEIAPKPEVKSVANEWAAKPLARPAPPPGQLEPFQQARPGAKVALSTPASALEAGHAQAVVDLRHFYDSVRGADIHHEVPFHNGAMASVAWGELPGGQKVVIRHVEDPADPVSKNNATHILNVQLGRRLLTLPSAVHAGADHPVMYMAHAPEGFVPGNHASAEWLARVPDPVRVLGALIDFLTVQQDRLPKNLMVDEKGQVALIDPDMSWGEINPWGANPSAFFPGQSLAARAGLASFAELPADVQQVVREIAAAAPESLAASYGVSLDAAAELKERAALVAQRGLGPAIEETRARSQRTFEPGQLRTKPGFGVTPDAITARVGKRGADHMVFGPYEKFPPGRLNVDFQLRLPGSAPPKPSLGDGVQRNGGPAMIGSAQNEVHRWGDGWAQDFDGGKHGANIVMRRDGSNSSFVVRGAIRGAYFGAGGGPGHLGFPVEDEHQEPGGYVQRFERGTITIAWNGRQWEDRVEVKAASFDDLVRHSGGPAMMGKPANAVHRWGDGWVQDFDGGQHGANIAMRRDDANASFVVRGAILGVYFHQGGGPGNLGYPLEDEHRDPVGYVQRFEHGTITIAWNGKAWEDRVETDSPVVATLDVYDGGQVLAKRDVRARELANGEWKTMPLSANVRSSNKNLEFRVWWHGNADLDAGKITTA